MLRLSLALLAATTPGWWIGHVGADQATPPGAGVPIAIVDSGVDPTHPEFANRPNTSFLDVQTVTGPEEFHGTFVASVALSIYPQATIESWDASPRENILDFSVATGIATVAAHCPAVINLSIGSGIRELALEDAILYAVHHGCLIVAAAGNDGTRGNAVTYPAALPHVLTVGATDANDQVASFSTIGAGIDLSAPGVGMDGSVPVSHDSSGTSAGLDGTSFAAPIVTAAAAWLWTARPTLDAQQVAAILRSSARDIGSTGYDLGSGFGILNIPAALAAPTPFRDSPEPNDDLDQIKPHARFDDGEAALTTASHASNRVAGSVDKVEDPRDVYRIWVPAQRTVRVRSTTGTTARIWGPGTVSVDEHVRGNDLAGASIRAGAKAFEAFAEVRPTGSGTIDYVLSVTAAKR